MLCDINGVDTAKWEDTHEIIVLSVFVAMVWLWRENWRRVKRWKNRGNNKDRKKSHRIERGTINLTQKRNKFWWKRFGCYESRKVKRNVASLEITNRDYAAAKTLLPNTPGVFRCATIFFAYRKRNFSKQGSGMLRRLLKSDIILQKQAANTRKFQSTISELWGEKGHSMKVERKWIKGELACQNFSREMKATKRSLDAEERSLRARGH